MGTSGVELHLSRFLQPVCICQAVFEFETEKKFQGFYELSSTAAVLSYLVFIGCFIVAKRKDSALVSPSQTMMKDIHTTELFLLFFAFVFIYVMPSLAAFIYYLRMNNIFILRTGVVAVFLAHWASVNTCNVFAVSSFALGKWSCPAYFNFLLNLSSTYGKGSA